MRPPLALPRPQVPVGSNLDLATYGGGTVAVESPEQIRQRYGEVAGDE